MANEFLKGLLRGGTADVLGTPVDLANTVTGLLAPPESGNPYANALRGLLGNGIETGSGDWWAQQMGLPEGQGLAYEAGRMLTPSPSDIARLARSLGPNIAELITYHGTPHRFPATERNPLGEFDLSKIGTGEGAQAYGHGIYLAESPDVAKTYKTAGSDIAYERISGAMSPMEEFAYDLATQGRTGEDLFSAMHQKYGKSLETDKDFDAFQAAIKKAETATGNLYKVDLPDEMIDRMLDWDKPFLNQSQKIKDWAKEKLPSSVYSQLLTQRSGDLVAALAKYQGGSQKASELMREAGIPGIKYLDQASRGAGEGTRNFVLFDPSIAKIIKRD